MNIKKKQINRVRTFLRYREIKSRIFLSRPNAGHLSELWPVKIREVFRFKIRKKFKKEVNEQKKSKENKQPTYLKNEYFSIPPNMNVVIPDKSEDTQSSVMYICRFDSFIAFNSNEQRY